MVTNNILDMGSEGRLQACIDGARLSRTERTRVDKGSAAIGEIGKSVDIEERSVGRVAIIEDIVDTCVDLERLVDLIGGAKIEHGISWQLGEVVGSVPDKILAAVILRVGTDLEGIGDGISDACLDAI